MPKNARIANPASVTDAALQARRQYLMSQRLDDTTRNEFWMIVAEQRERAAYAEFQARSRSAPQNGAPRS